MDRKLLRQLQHVQTEELKDIAVFCDQYDISYYLDSGTLLGAVRHQGFIPWDDDTDIAMDVSSYYRFLKMVKRGKLDKMYPGKYFVQNFRTDETMPAVWTKVRRNGMTVTPQNKPITDTHAGPCLDIFVMVGLAKTETGRRIQRAANNLLHAVMSKEAKVIGGEPLTKGEKFAFESLPYRLRRCLALFTEHILLFPTDHSEECFNVYYIPLTEEYIGMPSDLYYSEKRTKLSFEGTELFAPSDPAKVLELYYGDWKTPPPESERSGHGELLIDLEHDHHRYCDHGCSKEQKR